MAGYNGRQTLVYENQSPAVEGDFASKNPRATVIAGPGGLVAGPNGPAGFTGALVGRFGWLSQEYVDWDSGPAIFNTFNGSGPVAGFVHREQQGLITQYLGVSSMLVPTGFPITAFNAGDFWIMNRGTTQALQGMYAYANFADGSATFQSGTSSPANSATSTASTNAAETFSVTGSVSGNVLTVTAVASGTVYPGSTISGTGIVSGTMVVAQLSGTAGGVGTYSLSIPEQTAASTTVSGTYGLLTIGGTVTGSFGVGDVITTGTGITGAAITALVSGSGGAGTYIINNNTALASAAVDVATQVVTKWIAMNSALPGELVKCTSWVLG